MSFCGCDLKPVILLLFMVAALAILMIFTLKVTVTPRSCKGKGGEGLNMFKHGKLHALN